MMDVNSYQDIAESIATDFTLNQKQCIAFEKVVMNPIKRMKGENVEQLLLYIGGKGGTGKSQVVKAVTHFHQCLNIQHALRLTAFTGNAAANIGGRTIHSLAHLNTSSERVKADKLESQWSGVNTLIVDEISMVGCQTLSKLNERLNIAKCNSSSKPFDSHHDICQ